jgi:hypothetical protein
VAAIRVCGNLLTVFDALQFGSVHADATRDAVRIRVRPLGRDGPRQADTRTVSAARPASDVRNTVGGASRCRATSVHRCNPMGWAACSSGITIDTSILMRSGRRSSCWLPIWTDSVRVTRNPRGLPRPPPPEIRNRRSPPADRRAGGHPQGAPLEAQAGLSGRPAWSARR